MKVYEKKKIDLTSGETYAYVEAGNKKKPKLVLIHGNFSSSLHYVRLIELLENDYHIFAPDMRGFGDSTFHAPFMSFKELADDIRDFLKQVGVEKCFMLGWSLGGGVVMEYAAKYPETLHKFILMSSTTHKGYPVFQKDENLQPIQGKTYASPEDMLKDPVQVAPLYQAQQTGNIQFFIEAFSHMSDKMTNAEIELFAKESLKQRCLKYADWAISNINMSTENMPYAKGDGSIKKIKVPSLHMWGTKDLWLAPEYMSLDNYLALKPYSEMKRYESGHVIFADDEANAIKDIKDFFK